MPDIVVTRVGATVSLPENADTVVIERAVPNLGYPVEFCLISSVAIPAVDADAPWDNRPRVDLLGDGEFALWVVQGDRAYEESGLFTSGLPCGPASLAPLANLLSGDSAIEIGSGLFMRRATLDADADRYLMAFLFDRTGSDLPSAVVATLGNGSAIWS